jgi:hypothetical protein
MRNLRHVELWIAKRVLNLIRQGRKSACYDWWLFEQVKNVSKEKTAHPCQCSGFPR